MRTLLRILALVPLVLPTVGPATSGAATIGATPSDVVASMAGHWRCTSSTGSVSQRSYVVTDGGPAAGTVSGSATTRAAGGIRSSVNTPGGTGTAPATVARTVYGRQDGLDAGPFFERIVELSDKTLSVQSREGAGAGIAGDTSSLRFSAIPARASMVSEEGGARAALATARFANALAPQPVSLSYSIDPSGMRRIARVGSQTLSDERCTRDVQTASAACTTASAPAATLHAVQPTLAQDGNVQLRLVLDDRGRVVGENVLGASSPALTQAAIFAARDSTFTAAMANCRAVAGEHTLAVQFHAAARQVLSNGRETNL